MAEEVLVEVECVRSTAADIDYFEQGRTYTVDMVWARQKGIWKYFRPLREVSHKEAEERVRDEILPAQEALQRERAEANEEAEAKQAEARPAKSYPGPKGHATSRAKK